MSRLSFLAVVAASVVALLSPATSTARLPLHVGIADDASLFGDPASAAASVAAWQRAGVDTVRIQVSWSRIAPDPKEIVPPYGFQEGNPDDPGYHWGLIDQAVNRVVAAGMTPILMIDGPPPLWASAAPYQDNPRYRPRATDFGPFATAVARRYGDRVDQYILWNEPNLPLWLQPQATCSVDTSTCTPVSGDLYRAMVREAYQPMHDADPGATVLIGALAPAGGNLTSENANMRPLQFLRAMACVDIKLHPITSGRCANFKPAVADGIAYHAHSTRNAPDQPYANKDDADLASLSRVERLLDQLQQRGRLWGSTTPLNLWLDEYGYQTNPPDKARGVSMARQDRYLQQAAYLAWRDPRVVLLGQYLWNDEAVAGGSKYTGWQSGLIAGNGRAKPAMKHYDTPMWIDAKRSLIWGQMRPGGEHTVTIQLRTPGNATAWQDVGDLQTAPDGTWVLQTGLVPYGSYRAIAQDGETTDTMVATPAAATTGASGATKERTAAGVLVERRAVGTAPGIAVPPSFAGFSIEYWSALDYLGAFGQVNPAFAQLTRTLAVGGRGAPTIRLGGNSTDGTWWNPDGAPRPAGLDTDLNAAWLGQLRAWSQVTRTPMVLGVNLGLGDAANAAAYVQQAVGTLGAGALAGFEIGNEPDRYSQLRSFHVGTRKLERVERRPPDYSFEQYSDELDNYVRTLAPIAGGVGLSGGAFAGSIWDPDTDALLTREGPGTTALGAHAYALEACGSAARARKKASFARALLAPGGSAPIFARMGQLTSIATAHGTAFRVSEINSANCGGVDGVSNAFASALWGTDMLFGLAEAGVSNVDFHSWNGAYYSPVDFVHSHGILVARVHPLYYGMLLFDRALPAGARLLPVSPNSSSAATKTWATVDPAGTRRVVVINKDSARPRQVVLRVAGGGAVARVERLTAPSVLSKDGVTFAGQTYGRITADGVMTGKKVVEKLARAGGAFRLALPAGSAALVTVPAPR